MDPKKKAFRAQERDLERIQKLRENFQAWQRRVDPRRLYCIDEAGSHIAMTRDRAWAPRGEAVEDVVPRNRGVVTTMLGALSLQGLTAVMTVEGGTDGDVFYAYLEQVLLPELRPGDIVVLDNLGAHRARRIRELVESVGARLWFTPPYSPDLNPIELAWAKLKAFLKTAKARTREALDNAIAMAMDLITPDDASAWFRHCGFYQET